MKKTRLFKVLSAIIILVVAAVTLTVTMFNTEENHLISVQQEALKHLEEEKGNYAENKIVLQNTNKARAQELALSIGAELRTSKNGEFATLTLPEGVSIEDVYKNDNNRKYIEEMSLDYKVYLAEEEIEEEEEEILHGPNYQVEDTYYNRQTYLKYLNMQDVWNQTQGAYSDGEKVKVAVIDTGIDTDHPEFFDAEGNSIISTKSYDATNDKVVDMYDMSVIEDTHGHGTAVAGVIAAQFNGEGIVGIAPNVELLVIKCEIDTSTGAFKYSSDLTYGIYYAIEQDVDVINMSFGGEDNTTGSAIQLAVDSDIICVAAAGNDNTDTPHYPAADSNTIGVGALAQDSWELADYSNFGVNLDIVAPGTTYTSAVGGEYGYKQGTSLAVPIVTAAVALYVSQNKYVTFDKVKADIIAAGKDLGDLGEDEYFGYGCLDINAFIFEEKGIITWDYCAEEFENEEQVFVRQHTIQSYPADPEIENMIFDGWYYDKFYTRVFNYDEYFTTEFVEDITLYAKWETEEEEPVTVFAYNILEDNTIEITKYNGKRKNVIIPNVIDGYIVSSIGEFAFSGNYRVKSIVMPKDLKYIKKYAFNNCSNLKYVSFEGEQLLSIGNYAFNSCKSLIDFNILDSVESIGNYAFENCISLEKINISVDSNLISFGNYALSLTKISSIFIPKNATFNSTAFFGCERILSVKIHENNANYFVDNDAVFDSTKTTLLYYPANIRGEYSVLDSVTKIGDYAFNYSKLTSLIMTNNVLELGENVFSNSNFENIVLSEGLSRIPSYCFADAKIKEIIIPNSVTEIGSYAFANSKLEKITLSNNMTEITTCCFYGSNLKEITIPSNIKTIGNQAFANSKLVDITFEEGSLLTTISSKAFAKVNKLKTFDFPSGLSSIGEYAFEACNSIETIVLPNNLNSLGQGAFSRCLNLKVVTFEEGSLLTVISKNCFGYCTSLEKVIFSDDITEIGSYAFTNNYNLSMLVFGENSKLERIGRYAFYQTSSLKTMQVPSSIIAIDDYAYEFSGLTSVNIPSNLSILGCGVFGGCYDLISISVEEDNANFTSIDNVLFNYDVTKLYCVPSSRDGEYILPETVKIIVTNALYHNKYLINIVLPEGLEEIQESAFYGCISLESIKIPKNVFNIGRSAFYGCSSLKSVSFDDNSSLKRLGMHTFMNCGIESITIPASVTSMAQYVFYECDSLTSIVFAENSQLEYIAGYTFDGCENLQEIIFENGSALTSLQAHALEGAPNLKVLDFGDAKIENIDNYALYNAQELVDFIIPETVKYIGRYAFYNNKKIEKFNIPLNVEYIGENAFNTNTNNVKIFFESANLPAYAQFGWNNGVMACFFEAKDLVSTEEWDYVITHANTVELVLYKGNETNVNIDIIDELQITKVGARTFFNNDLITSVVLSSNIIEIGDYAFYGCDNLLNLEIPTNVEKIGEYAFGNSNVNVSFENSEKLIEIEKYAFSDNVTQTINLPDSVEKIGEYAFYNSDLSVINVNETSNLIQIGDYAFVGTNLEYIYLPTHLTIVGDNAFKDIKSLVNVEFAGGENNLKLGDNSFYNIGIKEVFIPSNVNYIGEQAFGRNLDLINIYVDENNSKYKSIEGVLCDDVESILIQYPLGREGVTIIPSEIKEIGIGAFDGSTKIREISFEGDSQLINLNMRAFAGCNSLTKITIPDSVESIGDSAFAGCTNLTEVVIGENSKLKEIGGKAFYNCISLAKITLPNNVLSIREYAFYN